MDNLIIRSLQKRTTPEEEALLLSWRESALENERAFRALADLWSLTSIAAPAPAAAPPPDFEAILETLDEEPEPAPEVDVTSEPIAPAVRPRAGARSEARRPARSAWRRRGRVVGIAIAASIGFFMVTSDLGQPRVGPAEPVLQIAQLATDDSETLMTQLSDGTTVYLAPNSTLRVSPRPGVREVWLDGRAFFAVAKHGEGWPFSVRSDRGTVHVLGTRFEFATAGEAARVIVVDGRVDYAAAGGQVQLTDGQMSVPDATGQPVRVEVSDVGDLLGWMGTALVFEETPLDKAAREIERRYQAVIELRGTSPGSQTISGGFKNRTFGEVVDAICRVLGAECSIGSDRAVIVVPEVPLPVATGRAD
jgi:ferric-dicitrate binding protein FerR (iron transport regulator)